MLNTYHAWIIHFLAVQSDFRILADGYVMVVGDDNVDYVGSHFLAVGDGGSRHGDVERRGLAPVGFMVLVAGGQSRKEEGCCKYL